jgi:signal transduction histidine kinase
LGVQPKLHHAAQFYESEDFLVGAMSRFVGGGLRGGEGIVVLATHAHLETLSRALEGFDLARAVDGGRAVLLDAQATLDRFMVNGAPDRARFRDAICPTLEGCRRASRSSDSGAGAGRVGAFGEMVDLLCRAGQTKAALQLEELWTEVCEEQGVSLLCAYALDNFSREADAIPFDQVCAQHDRIIPAERYTLLDDIGARQREIAVLQQRAHALKLEVQKRVELEHALRQAMREQRRAEHTSRMRDQLLAGLAQELRLPLKSIAGWASLLRAGQDIDLREAAETIEQAAHVQSGLLEEVTDASRVLGGTLRIRPGPVDLAFVLRESVEAVAHAAMSKGITLEVAIDSDPCLAHVDGNRIGQVFSTLLSNAVQFSPDGGRVEAHLSRTDEEVELVVRDNGCGIAASDLPSVFDRLRRVEEPMAHRATGLRLGLAVTRHLVELHGGTITAESEGAGRGATFIVVLPRRAAITTTPSVP